MRNMKLLESFIIFSEVCAAILCNLQHFFYWDFFGGEGNGSCSPSEDWNRCFCPSPTPLPLGRWLVSGRGSPTQGRGCAWGQARAELVSEAALLAGQAPHRAFSSLHSRQSEQLTGSSRVSAESQRLGHCCQ